MPPAMTVLACIDGSRYAAGVCDYAARAGLRLGVGVELLLALERQAIDEPIDRSGVMTADMADETLAEYARVNEARRRLDQERGRLVLDRAADRVRAAGVVAVQKRLVFGGVVDGLGEHESDARLIVMGRRGTAEGRATAHLGSNVERTVRASHRPILIVPPEHRPLRRFVVAYDAGPSAERIVDTLVREPLLLDAECVLLTVGADEPRRRGQLAAVADRLRKVGYTVHERLTPGHAEEVILATAGEAGADLLVMGAHGHFRVRTLLVGSTTTALLRASTVPVLVIR